ncbi:DUF3299 domain-containing protein [Vibrio ponticus]|uniref:DUF3299 domain-containing protein n=1 Tax=Vibrio ponticus TaxID=265668 RepID=A0A3N3E1G1_9VIBR|nr:DUF3299 domain-containing protein [Vibrio ponticus]ROV60581.1 DUF3299 domain-containing protein [Vibrio ponticus]
MNRLIALLVCLISFGSVANEPIELDWKDLRPVFEKNQIVLPVLSYEQKQTLQKVFTLSQYNDPNAAEKLSKLKAALKSEGLDADELLALRSEYIQSQQRAAETVTDDFNGKKVRVPGFLVPISFSAPLVATEFLLVPTAGACIHMPPPPANQIIRVSYPEGYQVETVQYPVWVEGVIHSSLIQDSVYLVDGDTDLTMGYTLSASSVMNYH